MTRLWKFAVCTDTGNVERHRAHRRWESFIETDRKNWDNYWRIFRMRTHIQSGRLPPSSAPEHAGKKVCVRCTRWDGNSKRLKRQHCFTCREFRFWVPQSISELVLPGSLWCRYLLTPTPSHLFCEYNLQAPLTNRQITQCLMRPSLYGPFMLLTLLRRKLHFVAFRKRSSFLVSLTSLKWKYVYGTGEYGSLMITFWISDDL